MLKQNTRVLLGTGEMPLIFESGSKNQRTGNDHHPPRQSSNTESGHLPSQSGAAGRGESSLQSKTPSNGRDGEKSDGDGAEADDVEEDDKDEDGVAPSGCTINEDGNQAGHIMSPQRLVSGGRKGKRRQSNPDDHASHSKVPRLTQAHGKTVKEPDVKDGMWLNPFNDGEENDQSIEQLEEKIIIESEERLFLEGQAADIPSPGWNSSDDWGGFTSSGDLLPSDIFEDGIGRDELGFLASGMDMYTSTDFFNEIQYPLSMSPPPRRVHFEESVMLSATGSSIESRGLDGETDEDLISPHDGLDSPSREKMEIEKAIHAQEAKKPDSPQQAFKRGRLSFEHAASIEQDSEDSDGSEASCGSSSGYETDLGETTDEEELLPPLLTALPSSSTALPPSSTARPPSSTVRPRPILPRNLISSQAAAGFRGPPIAGYPFPEFLRQDPPMGSWIADPTKPFAYSDRTGTFKVVHPQKKPEKRVPKVPMTPVSGCNTAITSPRASLPRFVSTDGSEPSDFSIQKRGDRRSKERPTSMTGSLRGGYIFGVQTPKPEEDEDEDEDSLDDSPVVDHASDGSDDGQDDKVIFSEFLEDYEDGCMFPVTFADSDDDDNGDDDHLLNIKDFFTRDYSDESAGEQQVRGGMLKRSCRHSAAINSSSPTRKRKLNCRRCSGSPKHVGQSGIASKKMKLNHR